MKKIFITISLLVVSINSFSMGSPRKKKSYSSAPKRYAPFTSRAYSSCVTNIESKFANLRSKYSRTRAYRVNHRVFSFYGYMMHLFNKNTLGLENHIQGIAKLKGYHNYILSGGDYKRKEAHLFVINRGRVTKKIVIGRGDRWHPGGIQVAGDVLAVPIQAYKITNGKGIIKFFDVRNPANPVALPIEIKMNNGGPGAVGFYRRAEDGKYIILTQTKVYISKSHHIRHGFKEKPLHGHPWEQQGQSLLRECGTRQLYLATFDNLSTAAPIINGKDKAKLFKINLNEHSSEPTKMTMVKEVFIKNRYMRCNFDAGAQIMAQNNQLKMFSTNHYRRHHGRYMYVCEF